LGVKVEWVFGTVAIAGLIAGALARIIGAFLLSLLFGLAGYVLGVKVEWVFGTVAIAGLIAGAIGAVLRITPMDFLGVWLVGIALALAPTGPFTLLSVIGYALAVASFFAILSNLYFLVRISELTDEERKALLRL
jgi:uncharacterized membrane protein AbrB (regulator of aidB expression)